MIFSMIPEEMPLYYFEQLSLVPRDSENEKGISDYVYQWALAQGLEAYQSDCWNVIIKKPASEGCENLAPVILQAHMDMVCEKDGDCPHDFTKDPIILKRDPADPDWITSAEPTTLGADNGIGVAYCIAVLADKSLKHPPIEVILTVEEESSFKGAENVDWAKLSGHRLINLDHATEGEVLCASAGGTGLRVTGEMQAEQFSVMTSGTTYQVADAARIQVMIKGLKGGHSGEDIHRGHGSANQMIMRALRYISRSVDIKLEKVTGGTSRLAISREATAEMIIPAFRYQKDTLEMVLGIIASQLKEEYQAQAPELSVSYEILDTISAGQEPVQVCTDQSLQKLLATFTALPDGIQTMSAAFPGNVESSLNLGILEASVEGFTITAEIRGGFVGAITEIKEKVSTVAELAGCQVEYFNNYMPWAYHADSQLRNTADQTFRKLAGRPIKPIAVHAGIECGCFLQNVPDLDAVAIGPDCLYFHSPKERMKVSSAMNVWEWLKEILTSLE